MNILPLRLFLVVIATVLLLFLPVAVLAKSPHNRTHQVGESWLYESSELNADPSIISGKLANGLRYLIKENNEPAHRVAAYLLVHAGSNEEMEHQQGVAHFLEHLMFNGSTHFPPGSLVEYFQSIGMDFGGDSNAYTGFDRTVYTLMLPKGDEAELTVGCRVLSDFARGALLLESEIEKERGVILSEKRARDSARFRNHKRYAEFAYKGTRYPTRIAIGSDDVLQNVHRAGIQAFYDSWYRPDNMMVVLVGDLEPDVAKKVIDDNFSRLKGVGEMPPRPDFGELAHSGIQYFYNFAPELGSTTVSLETVWDRSPKSQNMALEKERVIKIICDSIMGNRLQRLQEESVQPYVGAHYSSGELVGRIGYGSFRAVSDSSSWQKSLESLYLTLESAKQYGFSKKEVELAKTEIYASLRKNVETENSLHSQVVADRITDQVMDGEVYMSALEEQRLYSQIVDDLTEKEVHDSFLRTWERGALLVVVTGDANIPGSSLKTIADVYNALEKRKIFALEDVSTSTFPYLPQPHAKGTVAEKIYRSDIDTTSYTFTNGLVVHVKKTSFEPNTMRIAANFGSGEQEEYAPGSSLVVDDIVNLSGTSVLRLSELEASLAKSSVGLSFRIGRNASFWSGSALSSESDLLIELLYTLLVDPGCREAAYNKVMRRMELMQERLVNTIDGMVFTRVQPFWAGGNSHYGLPLWSDLQNIEYRGVAQWVNSFREFGDLEISVVGDVDDEQVISLLEKYFGDLSLGKPPKRVLEEPVFFPKGESLVVDVDSRVKKSRLFLTWPTDDFSDIGRTRRLSILAAIIEDRVRKNIREELGASYSPRVLSYASRMHKGFGYLQIEVDVESGKEDSLMSKLKDLIADLAEHGATVEELERAKNPVITSVKENIKTNEYWLYSVLSLSTSFPKQLGWPTTIVDDIQSISTDDINNLIRKYVRNDTLATSIVRSLPYSEEEGEKNGKKDVEEAENTL